MALGRLELTVGVTQEEIAAGNTKIGSNTGSSQVMNTLKAPPLKCEMARRSSRLRFCGHAVTQSPVVSCIAWNWIAEASPGTPWVNPFPFPGIAA